MQQSRRKLGYLWPLLAVGCGGFAPRDFGAKASGSAAGGIAGFSYDAGAPEGGKASVSPPPSTPNDWSPREPSGGESGGADDVGIAPPIRHSAADGGAAGEAGDGAAGHAAAGQGSGSGASAGGHAGRGGASGYGGATYGGASGHAGGGGTGLGGQAAHGGTSGSSGGTGGASSGGSGAGGGAGTAGRDSSGGKPALIFSEYVEGSHTYKALELRALAATSLEGCQVLVHSNSKTDGKGPDLTGTLLEGNTYVLCTSDLAKVLGETCNRTLSPSFGGNDAITLECGGVVIDAIGQVGFEPNPAWTADGVSTVDQTLRRRCSVIGGDVTATDAFDPSLEWATHPIDDFSGLGLPDCD